MTSCSAPAPTAPAVDGRRAATIKVADRVHDASKSLPERWTAQRLLLQLHEQRPRPPARARRRSTRTPTTADDRRDRRPPGHVVPGHRGRPRLLHGRRPQRGERSPTPNVRRAPRGRDQVGRRQVRPDLQRLRRDRARELQAGQDLGAAEPRTSRSASTSSPTGASSRPRAPARSACTTPRTAPPTVIANLAAVPEGPVHPQRGRALRPGRGQRLRPEQVGVPVLLAGRREERPAVRRLDEATIDTTPPVELPNAAPTRPRA